ncbi:hypothetical protein J3R30DRAFT_3480569 [Lentinula aciculospora]|uniref:Uncharacterized protein n=1 Tax=Lentinula aciculospora TaxID=153920 RepID=A0A9W9ABR3_9AGAR|nr:hypothetical protein J3R30DRAFT_3480569 [Lentinula aciculospora]
MFQGSSSLLHYPNNSQHMHHASHNGLNTRRYSSIEEFHPSEISHFSRSSSPVSSPAVFPRPLPISPSQHTHLQQSQLLCSGHSSTQSSPKTGYSRSSPYARRPSSPATSSSSPPPVTSPLTTFTRFDDDDQYYAYASKVKIVGRDSNENYLFSNNTQYGEDSQYLSRSDEFDPRPKLPSFKSLFGKGDPHSCSPVRRQKENDLRLNPFSSPMSSPSFEVVLPPLIFPPVMRSETNERKVTLFPINTPTAQTFTRSNERSVSQPAARYTESDHRDVDNLLDYRARTGSSNRLNARVMLLDIDSTIPLPSPTFPPNPLYQTPTRRKNLFSDADPPSTTKDIEITFFSPSKVSPFPRRTYFLESSERGRCSPGPVDTRCGLYQLAEMADMTQSAVKQDPPDQTEESFHIDPATSPSSSPSAYPSSLPPSSPPTSEAQLSPVAHGKDLPITTAIPLTDVMNLTTESRIDLDCLGLQDIELHKSLKPTLPDVSQLKNKAQETAPTAVSISFPTSTHDSVGPSFVAEVGDDEMQPSASSMDLESDLVAVRVDTTKSASPLTQGTEIPDTIWQDIGPHTSSSAKNEEPLPNIVHSELEPNIPTLITTDAVSVAPHASTSALKVFPKEIATNSNKKPRTKSISTAPSIASSAPRVTVNVVKRMRPASHVLRSVSESLPKKGGFTSVKGKEKQIPRTKTGEVLNSHLLPSNRLRPSGTGLKDRILEGPSRKKIRANGEEDQTNTETKSLSSSLIEATSTSFAPSDTSNLKSSSIVPAKRKADNENPSPLISSDHLPVSSSTLTSFPNRQKKLKAVAVDLPISLKEKLSSPAENDTWMDEHWVDAVAAAYGSPHRSPHIPRKNVAARITEEVDSSSDEDDNEPQSFKTKSPRSLHKRMIIESDSEEDDHDVKKTTTLRQSSEKRLDSESFDSEPEEDAEIRGASKPHKLSFSTPIMHNSFSSESELTEDEESEDEEEDEDISVKKGSGSKPASKFQNCESSLPPPSPFDFELVGIIVETMSLLRSSSHLALSLYRMLRETRNGIFATLMKANSAHLDTVTEKLRSKGLFGHTSGNPEQRSRRGRPKRATSVNEEGGTAGMSEADIMWVSEFERVMIESTDRCGMFGMVESSFRKDPRDLPLPFSSRFFYVPDCDPDIERAQLIRLTMPGSGKRSETKKYKQYYWKPVGK